MARLSSCITRCACLVVMVTSQKVTLPFVVTPSTTNFVRDSRSMHKPGSTGRGVDIFFTKGVHDVVASCGTEMKVMLNTCDKNQYHCDGRCGKILNDLDESPMRRVSCACDVLCTIYDDCCYDFIQSCPSVYAEFESSYGHMTSVTTQCTEDGFKVVDSCPDGYEPVDEATTEQEFHNDIDIEGSDWSGFKEETTTEQGLQGNIDIGGSDWSGIKKGTTTEQGFQGGIDIEGSEWSGIKEEESEHILSSIFMPVKNMSMTFNQNTTVLITTAPEIHFGGTLASDTDVTEKHLKNTNITTGNGIETSPTPLRSIWTPAHKAPHSPIQHLESSEININRTASISAHTIIDSATTYASNATINRTSSDPRRVVFTETLIVTEPKSGISYSNLSIMMCNRRGKSQPQPLNSSASSTPPSSSYDPPIYWNRRLKLTEVPQQPGQAVDLEENIMSTRTDYPPKNVEPRLCSKQSVLVCVGVTYLPPCMVTDVDDMRHFCSEIRSIYSITQHLAALENKVWTLNDYRNFIDNLGNESAVEDPLASESTVNGPISSTTFTPRNNGNKLDFGNDPQFGHKDVLLSSFSKQESSCRPPLTCDPETSVTPETSDENDKVCKVNNMRGDFRGSKTFAFALTMSFNQNSGVFVLSHGDKYSSTWSDIKCKLSGHPSTPECDQVACSGGYFSVPRIQPVSPCQKPGRLEISFVIRGIESDILDHILELIKTATTEYGPEMTVEVLGGFIDVAEDIMAYTDVYNVVNISVEDNVGRIPSTVRLVERMQSMELNERKRFPESIQICFVFFETSTTDETTASYKTTASSKTTTSDFNLKEAWDSVELDFVTEREVINSRCDAVYLHGDHVFSIKVSDSWNLTGGPIEVAELLGSGCQETAMSPVEFSAVVLLSWHCLIFWGKKGVAMF